MPPARSETPWGRALGRESLDTLLLAAAVRAGAQLWQPWAVTALNRTGGQYHCVLAGKAGTKEITARLVIAAHGSWEQSALTIDRRPHGPADLLAFKARFRNCALPPDLMPLLVFPGGYGGMVTSDDSQVTLSCCIRRDRLRQCRDSAPGFAAAEAVLRHIRRSSRAVDHVLADAKLDGRWLSAGPICPGMRPGYAEGVFRIGNAAGEAHPIIADGISMAIQSAWLLCRCLLAEQGQILPRRQHGETARAYGPEWRKAFGRRIRAAAIFAHLAMRTDAAAVFVPLLRVVPGILTIGARLSGKVAPIEWLRHSPAWP
jgi:flavin-dependent dehydrogenase